MELKSLITDNIAELLFKIVEFTQKRQKLLIQNINNAQNNEFIPHDLAVDEFSESLSNAIAEHAQNQRLLLHDTDNIKFGADGNFEAKPIIDEHAKELSKNNPNEYLELQISKLLENSLNQRIATELMKQKQGIISIFSN